MRSTDCMVELFAKKPGIVLSAKPQHHLEYHASK